MHNAEGKESDQLERNFQSDSIIRKAFESGHSVDRKAQATYEPIKETRLTALGFFIGILLLLFGLMPVAKYLVEDGTLEAALIGAVMITAGCALYVSNIIISARNEKRNEAMYLKHHAAVKRDLFAQLVEENDPQIEHNKKEKTKNG